MIPNEEKEDWRYLPVKNYLHYYMECLQNMMVTFIALIDFVLLEQKINFNLMKNYVQMRIFVELQCYI